MFAISIWLQQVAMQTESLIEFVMQSFPGPALIDAENHVIGQAMLKIGQAPRSLQRGPLTAGRKDMKQIPQCGMSRSMIVIQIDLSARCNHACMQQITDPGLCQLLQTCVQQPEL